MQFGTSKNSVIEIGLVVEFLAKMERECKDKIAFKRKCLWESQ